MTMSLSTAIDGLLLLAVTALGYGIGREVVRRMGEGAHERVSGVAAWLHRKVGARALPAVMAVVYSTVASIGLVIIHPHGSMGLLLSIIIVGAAQLSSIRSREP